MSDATLTTATKKLPERAAHLSPGQIDREVLAAAVTFALTSLRNVSEVDRWGRPLTQPTPGPGGIALYWDQETWVSDAEGCGTGCCIAGWIDVASRGLEVALEAVRILNEDEVDEADEVFQPREVAVWVLTGLTGAQTVVHAGLWDRINRLFQGDNGIREVIAAADALLVADGQPPLQVDGSGVFS